MKKVKVSYKAVKVISKPVKVEFFTREGGKVRFRGSGAMEVFDPSQLKTPDLIRWLRKNDFKYLAKALKEVSKLAEEELIKEKK